MRLAGSTLGIHRFASVDGAAAALPYFAAARRNALGYEPVDVGLFADQTEAMAGQAVNGEELIIYARRGNLIFRVDQALRPTAIRRPMSSKRS